MRELRTYYLETYGCQMNFSDAELIETLLAGEGLRRSEDEAGADLVLINTCGVREHAEQRVLSRLNKMKHRRRINPRSVIAVCGCMAQRMGDGLIAKAPWVDLVLGPDSYRRLPELLARIADGGSPESALEFDRSETYSEIAPLRGDLSSAWVPVTRGCDNFCSYCIVPYVRGRERSVDPSVVEEQVRRCVEHGTKEVVLLGQNVNSYRHGETGFAELLRRLDAIPGLVWLRFLTSHPRDLSDSIIEAMASCGKVVEHLHLPVQSGSDSILRAMNRGYSREYYLERVSRLRERIPGIGLTTDILAGFPGESVADYEDTLSLMDLVKFDYAYTFQYSERPGTRAASMPDSVPLQEKTARLNRAIEVQREHTRAALSAMDGDEIEVLVLQPARSGQNVWLGRTRRHFNVYLKADETLRGRILRARVTGSTGMGLRAEII